MQGHPGDASWRNFPLINRMQQAFKLKLGGHCISLDDLERPAERGYTVTRELLQELFGNTYKIAAAYMPSAWQTIKCEDVKLLQAFSISLRGCCNVS